MVLTGSSIYGGSKDGSSIVHVRVKVVQGCSRISEHVVHQGVRKKKK